MFYFFKDKENQKNLFKKTLIAVLVSLVVYICFQFVLSGPGFNLNNDMFSDHLSGIKAREIFKNFYAGENSIFKFWASPLYNFSLFLFPFIGFLIFFVKNNKIFSIKEKQLMAFMAYYMFICCFTVSRSPALLYVPSVCMVVVFAVYYSRINNIWFLLQHLVYGVLAVTAIVVTNGFNASEGHLVFPNRLLFLLLAIAMISLAAFIFRHWSRWFLVPSILLMMMSFTVGLENFTVPFSPKTRGKLEKKVVYVPTDFNSRHEIFRNMLPNSITKTYTAFEGDYTAKAMWLVGRGFYVALPLVGQKEPILPVGAEVMDVKYFWFYRGGLIGSLKAFLIDKNLFGRVYLIKKFN